MPEKRFFPLKQDDQTAPYDTDLEDQKEDHSGKSDSHSHLQQSIVRVVDRVSESGSLLKPAGYIAGRNAEQEVIR